MDSAEFLDLLGNANRRRILRLLAQKPCYVTEISEYLSVSPKAVIDHLRKLEDAGLIESQTDDRRRKYFSISRHIRLEVTVSPYEFGTKSAYPASSGLDITSCQHLRVELEPPSNDPPDPTTVDASHVGDLAQRLNDFEKLNRELSLTQRWTQGRITELREQLAETVEIGDPRIVTAVLVTLAEDSHRIEQLSRQVEVPPHIVEELLEELSKDGLVYRDGSDWHLAE